jgi:hypothetical protein
MSRKAEMRRRRAFTRGGLRLAVAAAVFAWLATELLWRPRPAKRRGPKGGAR